MYEEKITVKNRNETIRKAFQIDTLEKIWDAEQDKYIFKYLPLGNRAVNFVLDSVNYVKIERTHNDFFWIKRKDLIKMAEELKASEMQEAIEGEV